MITDIILYLAGTTLFVVTTMLATFGIAIPQEVMTSVLYFLDKLTYLEIVFPVETLMRALGIYLLFITYWYSIKLLIWTLKFIPFLKIDFGMPTIGFLKDKPRRVIHEHIQKRPSNAERYAREDAELNRYKTYK